MKTSNRQSGQIAILTVVIFMLLFSIVVVSFTRIMVAASHETVSDELRARAQAAAESGVEDAKRILTYCASNASDPTCNTVNTTLVKDQTCSSIINSSSSSGILNTLGLSTSVISGDSYQVRTGEGEQYYQCLQVSSLAESYQGKVEKDKSTIIPLNNLYNPNSGQSNAPVDTLKIEWHDKNAPEDGPTTIIGGSDLPSIDNWKNAGGGVGAPAVLRAEVVYVPTAANFSIDTLTQHARAVTLRPSKGSGSVTTNNASNAQNIYNNYPSNTNPNSMTVPLVQLSCSDSGASTYACAYVFCYADNGSGGCGSASWATPNGQGDYYLRLQTIYDDVTIFNITAYATDGTTQLYFKNANPEVDVTGRAQDAFQRIRANLRPSNGSNDTQWFPEYAVDSAGKVCKKLSVSSTSGTDLCSPY